MWGLGLKGLGFRVYLAAVTLGLRGLYRAHR